MRCLLRRAPAVREPAATPRGGSGRTPSGKPYAAAGGKLNPRVVLPQPRPGAYAIRAGRDDRGAPATARGGVSERGQAAP